MEHATPENPTIYIVIPVHNRLDATRDCLETLTSQTYQFFKVVVIDDGSIDGTSDYISQKYPEVTIIKGDGDLWWTGATNLGVRYTLQRCRDHDYILTLNNDTCLPPEYLETMISLSKRAPKALIGSVARDYTRRDVVIDDGVRISWVSAKFKRIKISQSNGSFYGVSVLPGRGTLIPMHVFREIGLFDEEYFPHYAADYDFSLRAAKSGYDLLLHPLCYLYSNTKLTGISNVHNRITFGKWIESFNSIKSSNNLKIRWQFGLRHAPLLCRPTFILCDVLRVILGGFRNQIKNLARS